MEDNNQGPFYVQGKRLRIPEQSSTDEIDFPPDDEPTDSTQCSIMTKILHEMEQIKNQLSFGSVASADDIAERTSELEAENAKLTQELESMKGSTNLQTLVERIVEREKEVQEEKPNYVRDRIRKIAETS
jgi:hypothetical protein